MHFTIRTKGRTEFIDITERKVEAIQASGVREGVAVVFAKHTTVSVIICDDEEGLKQDIRDALERLAPEDGEYRHNSPGDGNGFAHIRSVLIGCSVSVPIVGGRLDLGTWQRVFLVDFDERPREREVCITVVGGKH